MRRKAAFTKKRKTEIDTSSVITDATSSIMSATSNDISLLTRGLGAVVEGFWGGAGLESSNALTADTAVAAAFTEAVTSGAC